MMRTAWWLPMALLGCNDKGDGEEGLINNITVEATAVEMVQRVTWTATEAVDAVVEFGPVDDCDKFTTNAVSGTAGEVLLIGLPPSTEGCLTVVAGDERFDGPAFTTGSPPSGTSLPSVTINTGGDAPFLIASLILPPIQWAIDRTGAVVWANILDEETRQTTDVALNEDRTGFNFNDYAADHSVDDSYARFVGYDGAAQAAVRTPLAHHAYELFEDGRIVYLAIDLRDADYVDEFGSPLSGPVVGDVLVEQLADGTTREIWNAWNEPPDRIPLVKDADNGSFFPQGEDWTHADFFEYISERDSYLISFRNINSIIEVSAADGTWMRSVGEFGEYAIAGYEGDWEAIIGHPHNARSLDNGNILFLTMPEHGSEESRILELSFDDAAKVATIVWDYGQGLGLDAKVEGAGDRLPNGNTLVNWGAAGVIQEVTTDKTVVWEASFGIGSFAGHVHAVESFYPTP